MQEARSEIFFSITPLSQAIEQERRYSNKLKLCEYAQERQWTFHSASDPSPSLRLLPSKWVPEEF